MEESKSASGGPPSEQLTREQVMAQRAEKKKLKEARKNKSGGGGSSEASVESKVDTKQKKPPQQPKEVVPKVKPGEQQKSGEKKSNSTEKSKEPKQPPKPPSASVQKSSPLPTTSEQEKKPTEVTKANTKSATEARARAMESSFPLNKNASNSSVPEASKTPHSSSKHDSQYSMRSLFRTNKKESQLRDKCSQLDELFQNFGIKIRNDVIRGSNLRCVKLLATMKEFIEYFETPSGSTYKHGLIAALEKNLTILRKTCPFEIGMVNAIEYIVSHIYKINEDKKDARRVKDEALRIIDQYREEKIEKAVEAIVVHAKDTIQSGDVIMVYSFTEALLQLLENTANKGTNFELVLIQTGHEIPEIPVLLKKLQVPIQNHSIRISSVNFSSAIYRMRHTTKLIVGGHGLFTTGGVMAQSGSGKLALLASTYNKPSIFLCETYKFCDRSPIDFFALEDFITEPTTSGDELFEPKIKYDVTPANLVTVVITDIDLLPSSTVSVVLRVQEVYRPPIIRDRKPTVPIFPMI